MSVTVSHVNKYYGKQKVLNDICFSLKKGEICGFLGPNGAGKSTMMKIITGYLDHYEGILTVEDIDIRKEPLKAKAFIGYLPEHNPLYPEMYIREYLLHVARLYKTPQARDKVKDIIELTGLTPEKGKKIGQLSKGYRQRVGLAQALIHDPEILILDEPMTGLDPNQLEEIRNLIVKIGRDKTVMLSTHIMQEVEAICERIIIIDKGNIVADKYKNELHSSSCNGLVIEVQFTDNAGLWIEKLPFLTSVESLGHNSYRLMAEADMDPRIELFNAAAQNHCPILELKVKERSLEEIFKTLTGK